MERVIAYIDGFNFYHGMMAKGWGRYRWLDYRALMGRRIRDGQTLADVRLFTTMQTHQAEKFVRQTTYLNALRAHSGITPILGRFWMKDVQCQNCLDWYKRPQEKWTDVNIAVQLLADAHADLFDSAWLVCADGDLAPAVAHVRERWRKTVVLIDPPGRHSDEMVAITDAHWHTDGPQLRDCQLPEIVEYTTKRKKLRRYERPEEWA